MHMTARILPVLMFLVFAAGCSGKGGGTKEKWPEKSADGAPVVLEFVKIAGAGKDMRGEFKIFNFDDKDVMRLHMTLHYLDASGKELKDFPWSIQANPVVGAKKSAVIEVGAFLPENTASVKVELREVHLDGGGKWEVAKKAEEPAK